MPLLIGKVEVKYYQLPKGYHSSLEDDTGDFANGGFKKLHFPIILWFRASFKQVKSEVVQT
jgi:hypothetical protein